MAFALAQPGYQEIGLDHWLLAEAGAFGAPQFMPPGQRFVLIARDFGSVWGWWRPHPAAGLKALNGLDGWTCTIFRRTAGARASALVLDAERAIAALHFTCGPHGLLTYIWDAKVSSRNPGYCYKLAGWHVAGRCASCAGVRARSADDRKTLLHKPFALAGVAP